MEKKEILIQQRNKPLGPAYFLHVSLYWLCDWMAYVWDGWEQYWCQKEKCGGCRVWLTYRLVMNCRLYCPPRKIQCVCRNAVCTVCVFCIMNLLGFFVFLSSDGHNLQIHQSQSNYCTLLVVISFSHDTSGHKCNLQHHTWPTVKGKRQKQTEKNIILTYVVAWSFRK